MKTAKPIEFEYKLVVPREQTAPLLAHLKAFDDSVPRTLHAHYFDTERDDLAKAGMSLRVRREGDRWVQTLKRSHGPGNPAREEEKVELPDAGSSSAIDLERHAKSEVGKDAIRLIRRKASDGPSGDLLVERFATLVSRRVLSMKHGRSQIEVAFDQGKVQAGRRTAPLSELEIELKRGEPSDAVDMARGWQEAYELWIEPASKADRGRWLAEGNQRPFCKAGSLNASKRWSLDGFGRAMVANTLEQILPNAAAVAAGSMEAEHVHQLRVGLRRLRAVLRMLSDTFPELPVHAEPALAAEFQILGAWRDQQTLLEALKPELLEAGAPDVDWTARQPTPGIDLAATVRDAAFQQALIDLSGYAHIGQRGRAESRRKLRQAIRPVLRKLQRQVEKAGRHFDELAEPAQHQVRKRLKRLRYLGELAGCLYKRKQVRHYLDALEPAQDRLGRTIDLIMASRAAETAPPGPGVSFALEWLAGSKRKSVSKSKRALVKVAKAPPFWR